MARVDKKGLLRGKVLDLVCREYRGQQIVQGRPKEVKQTLATKESGLEFGLCSNSASVIRKAFWPIYTNYDGGMINRLTSAVRKGITACKEKPRGSRNVHDANLSYLIGFQFNNNSPLDKVLKIRPEAHLNEENKIIIELPAITESDIKGVRASSYLIRLVAVSFDFKKEVYSYADCKEIKIGYPDKFEGGTLELGGLEAGRMVLLSMSIHAFHTGFDGMENVNSKAWSPVEIIGAWHIPTIAEAAGNDLDIEPPGLFHNETMENYLGTEIQKSFEKIREKASATKKPKVRPQETPERTSELPKGDIGFSG